MSSSEEDDGELYDVPPTLRSCLEAVGPTQPSTYLFEDDDTPPPPDLMPKKSSGFNRSSAFLDRQTPNTTPIPAPRRLSSNRTHSDGFMKDSFDKPPNETRPTFKTTSQPHFSKSLDLIETRDLTIEVNLKLTGQEESNVYKCSSTEQLTATFSQPWPSPKSTSLDGLTNTEFELSTTNTDLLNQTTMPVPLARPVPKPRSRIKIQPTQSLDSSLGVSSQTVQNEPMEQPLLRHSEPMIELHSEFSAKSDERQQNYSYFSEQDPDAVELIQNGEVDKKYGLISVRNKINYSGFTELISDINHTASINGGTHTTFDDDDDESCHYVNPDSIRNGLSMFVPQGGLESAEEPPAPPRPHSIAHTPSYVEMIDKKQTHTPASSPYILPSSSHKHPPVHNSQQNINLGFDIFDESTTDDTSVPEDSVKGFYSNSAPNCTTQRPFHDIQPFKPKIPLTSHNFDVEEAETKLDENVNNSETDFSWSNKSKPVQFTSKDSIVKPGESSLNSPGSDFPVDWDSAFASPVTPDASSFLSSRQYVSAEESNGRHEASFSPRTQKPTTANSSLKPQNREQPFIPEEPTSLPPPLLTQPNHFQDHGPPPLPLRPNNPPSNLYTQTAFQSSLAKKNDICKPAANKDIFGELPTPTFSQNQSSDPFQDSNFGIECHQFNTNQVPSKNVGTESHQFNTNKSSPKNFGTESHQFNTNKSSPKNFGTESHQFNTNKSSPKNFGTESHQFNTNKSSHKNFGTESHQFNTNKSSPKNFGTESHQFNTNKSSPKNFGTESHQFNTNKSSPKNFGIEPHKFNTNEVPHPPSRGPLQDAPSAKAGVLSQDMVDAKATLDQNEDSKHLSHFVIPSPNSKELCSSDSESPDLATSETSDQSLDNGCGARRTRLKVFDSSLLPKKNARCGYLFKQGGYKANKGWKKRWVVYNGTNLIYFSNNNAQVSKRIIPVRCMVNIETDVKTTDKNSFRFKVITSLKDRVFVFSSETLDDCLTWANTLMAAVTEYKKSVKLLDQTLEKPDIEGFIKFGNMKKYYVTITGKILCYYQSFEDYQMGSPTHEIDMKLASVKVKDHKKLQLWIYYGHFNLTFESDQEMQQWRLAMEDAIAEGLADDTVLRKVYDNLNNQYCADCGVENPHWASVNLGMVLCKNCAGIHRMFDYRISKIRSLRMDTRVWTPSLVELMVTIGNANANAFWEFDMPAVAKIQPTESMDKRKEFIFKKYKSKQFCKLHPLANQGPALGEVLLKAASHDNVLEMISILFSGADVLYRKEEHEPTAYDVAKEHGQRLIMELLYQNGGDPQTSEQDVTDENRLREDVRLQGYLNKTGSVGRSFQKRWCILEHGALTYYLSEKSKTFRGSIHRRNMYLIQATESDRIGYLFELSTDLKDNRIFTLSADTRDDCGEWIRTIGKLMAPLAVMDQVGMIDVKLAGYAFMKESLVDEWHQTFLVFSWRGIHYMNRDLKFDYLDLRKASGIKMQDSSNSYQQRGPCFVISSTGKSVYLQAVLTRDTEKMYTAFLEAIVSSGPTLIDQALTNENVPLIVEKCITHIYMNGLEERGIYRVAGQNSRVQALLDEFRKDVWSVCMNAYTVQDVSNVLKRFLRELDDSVFGRLNYGSWINKAGCKDVNNRLMWYKYYLEKMPNVNFQTLKRIVLHLVQVSQHENVNLMSINNLASCFAPSLMRTANDDPLLASDAAGKEISIMVDLLSNSDYFFNVNDNERIILNNIRWAEKEIQKRIQENRISVVDPATAGMLIPVHLLSREGQSVNILITEEKTAKEAMEYLKRNKTVPDLGIYVLHEQLFKGALERPLFPEDIISKTTNRWMEWESWVMEDNNVCLCVQGLEMLEKLNTHFSPNHSLLSKHQYCDSKPKSRFKRRVLGFRQCKLALYSDSQGNSELISWKVEDITIYVGSVPRKTLPPYRYCLTFTVSGEKYTKPSFGHCISFETENELCRWTSALYAAQHPTGLLSWAKD